MREVTVLSHPVRLQSMILPAKLEPELALDLNREFLGCPGHDGATQSAVQATVEKPAGCAPRAGRPRSLLRSRS